MLVAGILMNLTLQSGLFWFNENVNEGHVNWQVSFMLNTQNLIYQVAFKFKGRVSGTKPNCRVFVKNIQFHAIEFYLKTRLRRIQSPIAI